MRSPRRHFAAPFVITIASAGVGACSSAPPPDQPPYNPPPPTTTDQNAGPPTSPDQNAGPPTSPDQNAGPPTSPDQNAGPPRPDPRPRPTTTPQMADTRWTVTKSGSSCMAMLQVECPKGEPGKPMPTCNPPPPFKYDCTGLTFDRPIQIVQQAGQADCYRIFETPKCPPQTACNPPRPQKVACPKR